MLPSRKAAKHYEIVTSLWPMAWNNSGLRAACVHLDRHDRDSFDPLLESVPVTSLHQLVSHCSRLPSYLNSCSITYQQTRCYIDNNEHNASQPTRSVLVQGCHDILQGSIVHGLPTKYSLPAPIVPMMGRTARRRERKT
jgi:hypothetical protein